MAFEANYPVGWTNYEWNTIGVNHIPWTSAFPNIWHMFVTFNFSSDAEFDHGIFLIFSVKYQLRSAVTWAGQSTVVGLSVKLSEDRKFGRLIEYKSFRSVPLGQFIVWHSYRTTRESNELNRLITATSCSHKFKQVQLTVWCLNKMVGILQRAFPNVFA